jgi:20S proteasome alpha/beta subunit
VQTIIFRVGVNVGKSITPTFKNSYILDIQNNVFSYLMIHKTKQLNLRKSSSKLPNMTYVLGSRCSDGVVIVADRKHTIEQKGDSVYDNKIFGEFSGIITSFSGIRGNYELLLSYLFDYINKNGSMNHNEFLLKARDITLKLKSYDYDILFGVSNTVTKNSSYLKHMYPDGKIESIRAYVVIGHGEPVGRYFLKKYWKENLTMKQVAKLGYFIIKVIERYNVEESVGLGNTDDISQNKPQIWFIPDNRPDYPASDCLILDFEGKVNERIKKLENERFF